MVYLLTSVFYYVVYFSLRLVDYFFAWFVFIRSIFFDCKFFNRSRSSCRATSPTSKNRLAWWWRRHAALRSIAGPRELELVRVGWGHKFLRLARWDQWLLPFGLTQLVCTVWSPFAFPELLRWTDQTSRSHLQNRILFWSVRTDTSFCSLKNSTWSSADFYSRKDTKWLCFHEVFLVVARHKLRLDHLVIYNVSLVYCFWFHHFVIFNKILSRDQACIRIWLKSRCVLDCRRSFSNIGSKLVRAVARAAMMKRRQWTHSSW